MNDNASYVIGMGLETRYLLARVIVVDSQLEVIATTNDPVLARNWKVEMSALVQWPVATIFEELE